MKPILWIYGPSGSGKTEFAKTITQGLNTLFIGAKDFTDALIDVLAHRKPIEELADRYQWFDVVVIDDVDYSLRGKPATQKEYKHLILRIVGNSKTQVILISRDEPRVLPKLKFEFYECLFWPIQLPSAQRKLYIVRDFARTYGIDIPTPILEYMAQSARNLFELKGMFLKVCFAEQY